MKKTIKYIFPLCLALGLFTGCNDDFLERSPHDKLTDKNFWKTEEHLKSVTVTFTSSMSGKDWLNKTESMAESAPWAVTQAYRTIGGGNFNRETSQINSFWKVAYTCIGRCNYFLNNYNRAEGVKKEIRERYAAEAYFYRAFNYWLLTTYFGDVPYIVNELNIDSPEVYKGRDKKDYVISEITKDLEEHYKSLPDHIPAASKDFGRVSQSAALTLLSRIYLYNEMWTEAADAAKRAMDLPYYELYKTGHPESDYVDLFTYKARASRNASNHEVILSFNYNYDLGETARTSHNLSRECWVPNDYARFVPTQSMIECYLTSDGQIWDPKKCSTYEEVFEERDPRMCQSILSPGTRWEGGASGDKLNQDKAFYTYPLFENSKKGCMTYTGYYMRKYVEPSTVKYVGHDDNDIIMFRYAEILLNYAEAKANLNTLTQDDLDMTINKLRDRVGMVHLELGNLPKGSDLMTEIRRERRVELFFEGHRYFDIIRWKQGELLANDLLGVNKRWIDWSRVTVKPDDFRWKNLDGEEYMILEDGRRFISPKNYLLPVPFAQTQLNPNLLPNNEGW